MHMLRSYLVEDQITRLSALGMTRLVFLTSVRGRHSQCVLEDVQKHAQYARLDEAEVIFLCYLKFNEGKEVGARW